MSDVQRSPYTGRPVDAWLTEDLELHDAEGDEVGRVMEINPDFIVAETGAGFLGLGERHLYYVPRDQVSRADDGDWYLAIEKDQLEWAGWTQAPAESAWSQEWEEGAAPVQRSVGTRIRRYGDANDSMNSGPRSGDTLDVHES
ncbi:hypothetical protein BH24CHL7_BH24CHL7_10170 [soil metagenome]